MAHEVLAQISPEAALDHGNQRAEAATARPDYVILQRGEVQRQHKRLAAFLLEDGAGRWAGRRVAVSPLPAPREVYMAARAPERTRLPTVRQKTAATAGAEDGWHRFEATEKQRWLTEYTLLDV